MSTFIVQSSELKYFLDEKFEHYNSLSFIESDPISIPHLFTKKEDIEISAFIAATLAWGQRSVIIRNAKLMMEWMDQAPYSFICSHQEKDLLPFYQFKHRTFNGDDCVFFIKALKQLYTNGGLENAFKTSLQLSKDERVQKAISHFRTTFLALPHEKRMEKHLANPIVGSSTKRLNMFLRWMVRKDKKGVDFGIWGSIDPADLICPLDVHSGRVARKLNLLTRKQNDWKAALELTQSLRELEISDPVKYDFSLFGLGIFEHF